MSQPRRSSLQLVPKSLPAQIETISEELNKGERDETLSEEMDKLPDGLPYGLPIMNSPKNFEEP